VPVGAPALQQGSGQHHGARHGASHRKGGKKGGRRRGQQTEYHVQPSCKSASFLTMRSANSLQLKTFIFHRTRMWRRLKRTPMSSRQTPSLLSQSCPPDLRHCQTITTCYNILSTCHGTRTLRHRVFLTLKSTPFSRVSPSLSDMVSLVK
jgi:hypothetical protein